MWPVWGNLLYSVRTGNSARALVYGTENFLHLERDADAAAVFNNAMVELTRLTAEIVVRAYDFSGLEQIVDVGGGYGELLASILLANPLASGILFDLPHAIEGARRHFEDLGLTGRCAFSTGDFFESVPQGADAYIFKNIIHDWNDDRAQQLLSTCRRGMGVDSRLLLIEQILPDRVEVSPTHQGLSRSDLNMLVANAAPERLEREYRHLLHVSGFASVRIIPTNSTFSIIEAFPR
jgi:hypothetical protein